MIFPSTWISLNCLGRVGEGLRFETVGSDEPKDVCWSEKWTANTSLSVLSTNRGALPAASQVRLIEPVLDALELLAY